MYNFSNTKYHSVLNVRARPFISASSFFNLEGVQEGGKIFSKHQVQVFRSYGQNYKVELDQLSNLARHRQQVATNKFRKPLAYVRSASSSHSKPELLARCWLELMRATARSTSRRQAAGNTYSTARISSVQSSEMFQLHHSLAAGGTAQAAE